MPGHLTASLPLSGGEVKWKRSAWWNIEMLAGCEFYGTTPLFESR